MRFIDIQRKIIYLFTDKSLIHVLCETLNSFKTDLIIGEHYLRNNKNVIFCKDFSSVMN